MRLCTRPELAKTEAAPRNGDGDGKPTIASDALATATTTATAGIRAIE